MIDRAAGILLHVSSLPSAYGIGDLGPGAYRFLDVFKRSGMTLWQVLPLHPIDAVHGNSPYSSASAFAGNRYLISPDRLIDEGFLDMRDTQPVPEFPDDRVDYDAVVEYKTNLLDLAWNSFRIRTDRDEFEHFCEHESGWLDDYALFVVIKRFHDGVVWSKWPKELRDRNADALEEIRRKHNDEIEPIKFEQFLFFRQWTALKETANQRGIRIFGDIPIYVNYDSADTWANTEIFKLNDRKRPTAVAGVPPDYFSKTGQLWGNPVYDWQALGETNYSWWIARLEHMFRLYDVVRIDHFRGLVAFWEVPASHKTAQKGNWVDVPADDFLTTLKNHFDELPVVAEDLGTITEDVTETMERYGFPGMKILLFAFGEDNPKHPYLPHNYEPNAVVYTGTHDNNTVLGWFDTEARKADKKRLYEYLGSKVEREQLPVAFIRLALRSPANWAVIPLQDVLGLGESARMNTPATRNGNWGWRVTPDQLKQAPVDEIHSLVKASGRDR